jgi:hypothetical protein
MEVDHCPGEMHSFHEDGARDQLLANYSLVLLFNPEDGGSMFLQNTGGLLQDYMSLHPSMSS